jgi:hypothetical protein
MFDNLLIFYAPGARGDFLASIVLNQLQNQTSWHILSENIIDPYIKYIKAHDLTKKPGFAKVQIEDLIINRSIRIKLNTVSDFLSIVYYSKAKISFNKELSADNLLAKNIIKERQHRKLDAMFDCVIDFSNLFNIEFIKDLYVAHTGNTLPDQAVERIQKNIDLHPILNLGNYQNYLNIVNIDKFLKDYEQTFRIGFN